MIIKKVTEGLWRGSRPHDLQFLKDEGFDTIIDCQSGIYEAFHEDLREQQFAVDFGIKGYDLRLSDFIAPKRWKVIKALDVITKNKKVYLHCKFGKDRTGFIVAVYRMVVQGWSYEKAKEEMFKHGFHKLPYVLWLPELKSYEGFNLDDLLDQL